MTTRHAFFFDSRVADWQSLLAALPEGSVWFLLDLAQDGVEQIRTVLLGQTGLACSRSIEAPKL